MEQTNYIVKYFGPIKAIDSVVKNEIDQMVSYLMCRLTSLQRNSFKYIIAALRHQGFNINNLTAEEQKTQFIESEDNKNICEKDINGILEALKKGG